MTKDEKKFCCKYVVLKFCIDT